MQPETQNSTGNTPAVDAIDVYRDFGTGRREVHAVAGITLSAQPGEVVAIMGPSGCGKTTLLHLLGGLDDADNGDVLVDGVNWRTVTGRQRSQMRRRRCGFIFPSLALLPLATAAENVEVPLQLDGVAGAERRRRVAEALDRVDILAQADHLIDQLSGGQQQRVAIARALVHQPALVLADEPTGSLDSVAAATITQLLVDTARERNAAVILVTHDPRVARAADRVLTIRSGQLLNDNTSTADNRRAATNINGHTSTAELTR